MLRETHRHLPYVALAVAAVLVLGVGPAAAARKLFVVATLPTYGSIAEAIVGERGEVHTLVRGYEDPHAVRPKPSLALLVGRADLLVATGLDLELWLPALLDRAGNPAVRSGQRGFVSASEGIALLERPAVVSRSEGDVHVYGNPHVYTGPLNGKVIARNITVGLSRVDPEGASVYERNFRRFVARVDEHLFGAPLIRILGAPLLTRLALSGRLVPFLEAKQFRGKPLSAYLGGWMKRALPLRGMKIVTYHKNWVYFAQTFGLEIVETIEPKPGIPPSPGHVARVIELMQRDRVRVVLAANYHDTAKVKSIASRVGATPVVVGLAVGAEPAIKDFFCQFDVWLDRLLGTLARRP